MTTEASSLGIIRAMALLNEEYNQQAEHKEDMGGPTCRVQGRGDLKELAGYPCKKRYKIARLEVNSLEHHGEIAREFPVSFGSYSLCCDNNNEQDTIFLHDV